MEIAEDRNLEKDIKEENCEEGDESKDVIKTAKAKREPMRNLLAFYAFGALIYTVYSVIISGAQDILAGTFIPTAAVLVTNVGPYFLVTMIAPYFIHKMPYVVRIVAIYAFFTAGLFIIVYAKEVYLKLVGICTTSLGAGIGEVSFFYINCLLREGFCCCLFSGYRFWIYLGTSLLYWFDNMELCITEQCNADNGWVTSSLSNFLRHNGEKTFCGGCHIRGIK